MSETSLGKKEAEFKLRMDKMTAYAMQLEKQKYALRKIIEIREGRFNQLSKLHWLFPELITEYARKTAKLIQELSDIELEIDGKMSFVRNYKSRVDGLKNFIDNMTKDMEENLVVVASTVKELLSTTEVPENKRRLLNAAFKKLASTLNDEYDKVYYYQMVINEIGQINHILSNKVVKL